MSYFRGFSFTKAQQVNLSLSDDQVDQFYEIFANNSGRNGKLRLDKLIQIMEENDFQISKQQHENYMNKLQLQDGAYMSFPQFTNLLARKMLEAQIQDQIKQLFKIFDTDSKGYISAKDMKRVLVTLNTKITDDDVDGIVRQADTNQDGVLDYEQFVYMCLPK